MDEIPLNRTPVYPEHARLGAKLIPFAGWEMPVHYRDGILAEHKAVREHAGLFDVSHMGELFVRGERALDFLQYTTTNDVSKLAVGQAQYSCILQEDGMPLDDCIVYRFEDHYMVVVNASNRDVDFEWLEKFAGGFGVELEDRSDEIGLLALQGPAASSILAKLTDTDLDAIRYYHFAEGTVAGRDAIISRTGYTGEDGFELYLDGGDTLDVWNALFEADPQLKPIGLGARDSLRLEVGYALYGNDLDLNHTPLEAGLGWIVKLDKPSDFIGRAALVRQKTEGIRQKLVGFVLKERGFPRHGYPVHSGGEAIGVVTSGVVSPSLGQGIGMAWVAAEASKPGTTIEVVIRDKGIPAEVVRPPFYKDGTVRK